MRKYLTPVLMVLVVLAGACGDDDDPAAVDDPVFDDDVAAEDDVPAEEGAAAEEAAAVTIQGFAFDPQSSEVPAGTTVTWTNEDGTTHTVTSGTLEEPSGTFDESVESGATVEVDFSEAGTYEYFCAIHPDMTGEVVVS